MSNLAVKQNLSTLDQIKHQGVNFLKKCGQVPGRAFKAVVHEISRRLMSAPRVKASTAGPIAEGVVSTSSTTSFFGQSTESPRSSAYSAGLLEEFSSDATGHTVLALPDSETIQKAFQPVRDYLYSGYGFEHSVESIDRVINQHFELWVNANFRGKSPEEQSGLNKDFFGSVQAALFNGRIGSEGSTVPSPSERPDSPVSSHATVVTINPGQASGESLSPSLSTYPTSILPRLWSDEISSDYDVASQTIEYADSLPKAKTSGLFGSRSSEFSRLSEVAKRFSWFAEPISAASALDKSNGKNPAVVVTVNKENISTQPLSVKFSTRQEQDDVNAKARSLLDLVLSSNAYTSGSEELDALFVAQLENSGIDRRKYNKAIGHAETPSQRGGRLSSRVHAGLMTGVLPFQGPKKSLEQKALNRVHGQGGNNLSALTDTPKQFDKAVDKAFLTYVGNQQALWNRIKPQEGLGSQFFNMNQERPQVHFNFLDQIGFNRSELTSAQVIQMGKLVMSAVGAATVRSPLSEADVAALYGAVNARHETPVPMSIGQFREALGPAQQDKAGELKYGILGSQLLDSLVRLNQDPRLLVSGHEHQIVGNLLTLMMLRQGEQTQSVLQRNSSPGDGMQHRFTEHLIMNTKNAVFQGLRPYIKDDKSMGNVLNMVEQAIKRCLNNKESETSIQDLEFLEDLKVAVLNDRALFAAVEQGLKKTQPALTRVGGEITPQFSPHNRQRMVEQFMEAVAKYAHICASPQKV